MQLSDAARGSEGSETQSEGREADVFRFSHLGWAAQRRGAAARGERHAWPLNAAKPCAASSATRDAASGGGVGELEKQAGISGGEGGARARQQQGAASPPFSIGALLGAEESPPPHGGGH